MLRPARLLHPFFFLLLLFWSCWTLNVVVSEPQTNLLYTACSPFYEFVVSNFTIFSENLNATFRDLRDQVKDQSKHFATSQRGDQNNPASSLFQCRDYLSIADCLACFDVAAVAIRNCSAGTHGSRVVYDGCFLRYEVSTFFSETTSFNAVSCGNRSASGEATEFTSAAQKLLTNLRTTTPTVSGFYAASKTQVPNNGPTIYAFAQCIETITQSACLDCLNAGDNNMQTCLPNSDGRAYAAGCFIRYSTSSFFPDNQTINTIPLAKQGSSNNKGAIIGGVVGAAAVVLVLLGLFVWIKRPKKPQSVPRDDIPGASKLKAPEAYNYRDLKLATKNFSDENKLGEGGFGAVYKGTLKNGKVVAVKKLTVRKSNRMEEEFESEVKLISNVHHRNLTRLLGCCSKGDERILVYEYMKNTSLDRFLFGKRRGFLTWKQRYDIIVGTARGLTYLHEEFHVRIIHRDIKTNNILLDDDFQPRIADFGLARLLPENKSHVSTRLAGTLGYTAPEYAIHGQLSEKADVFSYGVVILEIISGKRSEELKVHGHDEGEFLLQKAWKLYEKNMHLELVDKTLDPNDYDEEEVKKVIEIGLLCTQAYADIRPTMSEVVVLLQNKDLSENRKPTMPLLIEAH
ncbi:cysteine-rich receptor-like protein kinase 2 [Neltuma alba]|uniref:cysteine-rich receptor-like protein kinase 2 n=1 Tax=Neltuma alba TaxID=207710 RepID=UPI0010A39817|nr:cysteine-rich receptor-like protein kinase 2 [Prosopis alba]